MTQLLTYPDIDPQQWQALVDSSPYATWFQTKEAYEFYAAVGGELIPFALGIEENGHLTGVIVGYTTQEKNPIKQFLTRRAIIIGGPLLDKNISDESLKILLLAVKRLLKDAIYIETRNFNDYTQWRFIFDQCGFAYQPHLNFHQDCTKENILSSMSESRRRQIKKAIKNGVEIVEASSIEEVKAFYDILFDLYRNKIKTPLFAWTFFKDFYIQSYGKYFLVKYQDTIIGGIMCPILQGKAIYEWFVCGLDDVYKNQYPSVMATYAAIEYANKHNIPLFDFMGAGKPNEAYGVRDFKARFGGEQVEHGRFLCVRKNLLYAIGKFVVKLLKNK